MSNKSIPSEAVIGMYALATKFGELVKEVFPETEQAQALITIPHKQLTALATENPSLSQGKDEPYLKLGVGNIQIVLTSEEALLVSDNAPLTKVE